MRDGRPQDEQKGFTNTSLGGNMKYYERCMLHI